MAEVTERKVQGAGLEVFVTERGDAAAPTVVLVHGFPDTSAVWEPVASRLAQSFHTVTYDVRGAGRSDVPTQRADYELPLLVDDMAAVFDAVSPERPVHLVAHDWGSIQAWETVTTARLAGRLASYTSISGPPIDHAGLWMRRHRTRRLADVRLLLRQGMHSWYIAYFHLPGLPALMVRNPRAERMWAWALHRVERVPTDDAWPAPTFGADFAHGVQLYRANIRPRLRRPTKGRATCPVQMIVPTKDRYVTPALLDGLEEWAPTLWRREVTAGHWVIRTNVDEVCRAVTEVVGCTEGGEEAPALAAARVSAA